MLTSETVNYSFLQADEEWVVGACDALTLMHTNQYTQTLQHAHGHRYTAVQRCELSIQN